MFQLVILKRLGCAMSVFFCGICTAFADITIMPVGDSITFGAGVNTSGYRYPLFINLTRAGIGFHYIGQNPEHSLDLPVDQQHHNGYPGATIEDIQNNLQGDMKSADMVVPNYGGHWMTGGKADGAALKPDVILLLIGANNIYHKPKDCDAKKMQEPYRKLVQWFLTNRPDSHLIISTVLPMAKEPRQNETVIEFDKWLKSEAPSWGPKCRLVDICQLFLNADGSANTKLLADGIHPNKGGYDVMAEAWSKAIEELVAKGDLKKEAPVSLDGVFEPAKDKESPTPSINSGRAEPATAAAGASITVSGTVSAGNNRLTAPVVTFSLTDGKTPTPVPITETVTLSNILPHKSAPLKINIKLPVNLAAGSYFISIKAKAPECEAKITYGPKITVAK